MKIGWVGLGEIGHCMALRALSAGHKLEAYDRGTAKEQIAAKGASLVSDYAKIAANCEILCVCVFSDAQVREVMYDGGALKAMKPGSIVAIHTTGSPTLAQELGNRAPDGVSVLDACFSGGPQETIRGELTLMVGGDDAALEKAKPVFSTYASQIHNVGPLGAGQLLKLLNNLLFATNLMQAAEMVDIAASQGLDPHLAAQVICQSSGSSMAMSLMKNATADQMLSSSQAYMKKDVQTVVDIARETGIDITAFRQTVNFFL